MTKPTQERIERVAEAMIDRRSQGFRVMAKAALTADDSHLAAENERLRGLLEQAREALQQCDDAMGYMSEYDIPLCLPDDIKAALSAINEATGEK